MKSLLLGTSAFLLVSASAFAGDITVAFSPDTQVYPPSADSYACEIAGGGASPCVIFSGTITDTDIGDETLSYLTGIALSDYTEYFTVDNTFYNAPGVFEGNLDSDIAPNSYTGAIMGIDINPDTPWGTYTLQAEFNGYGGDTGPDGFGNMAYADFTVVITPEPVTGGLTLIGLLALAASRRLRRTRPC